MDADQKTKLVALLSQQHLGVLITLGDTWPTGTMQSFAENDALDLIFIMNGGAEKFQNLSKRPHVTVVVDNRDVGDVPKFQVARVSIQGIASEIPRGSADWEAAKAVFLKKNPFEAPFFSGGDALRMVRIKPKRISYAGAARDTFKTEM